MPMTTFCSSPDGMTLSQPEQWEASFSQIWSCLFVMPEHVQETNDSRNPSEPVQAEWTDLPGSAYSKGRGEGFTDVIDFQLASGERRIRLADAIKQFGAHVCLQNADEPVLLPQNVPTKLCVRFPKLSPDHEPYSRQITTRRSTCGAEPVSYRQLARKIAEEAYRMIALQRPIYNGRALTIDNLALCSLRRVSKGSWEVVLQAFI
ncbi:uncharacterized protein BXZ73DRAFT_79320 [Epithele typhae]|uniref:uncharacterized protein n=1 Tax=Epithele typhae TaxID=378194 RepID=UPI002007D3CA|nr:uncharacterized protein BXZ73DRAFT_79320 [Epithele typhae]KAH9923914.1 hypothetical protein BXZ73DRAFT_79320 [Epithele typhae]